MPLAGASIGIAELRRLRERTQGHGCVSRATLPFGVHAVDSRLPGGGLALGHLHEVMEGGAAAEYATLATLFTAGILARLTGSVLWCLRSQDLFAPALARIGLHPDRVIYCETRNDRNILAAMEEGLACKGLAGVVGEVTRLSLTASRRLQLRAAETGVTVLAIRRWRSVGERDLAGEPTAATTRWQISPSPSLFSGFEGLWRQRWQVELLRARGGEPHSWILEACDAQGHLAVPAVLADGSTTARGQWRAVAG